MILLPIRYFLIACCVLYFVGQTCAQFAEGCFFNFITLVQPGGRLFCDCLHLICYRDPETGLHYWKPESDRPLVDALNGLSITQPQVNVPLQPILSSISCILNFVLELVGVDENPLPLEHQVISKIEFHAYIRLPNGTIKYYALSYGDETPLKAFGNRYSVTVYFHGVKDNGFSTWIQQTGNVILKKDKSMGRIIISVDYEKFFTKENQAVINVEPIANFTAEFFKWAGTVKLLDLSFVGHGMGSYVASKAAEKLNQFSNSKTKVLKVVALDPDIINSKCYEQPLITKSQAKTIIVIHTTTCSFPNIQACANNTNATMGHIDFYPNGGISQPGCGSNFTCSKYRATDLYYESTRYTFELQDDYHFFAWPCTNFDMFQNRFCNSCSPQCNPMTANQLPGAYGRYFLYTNDKVPYGRGNNQTART